MEYIKKNLIKIICHNLLLTGVTFDGNIQGALRAIREIENSQKIYHERKTD